MLDLLAAAHRVRNEPLKLVAIKLAGAIIALLLIFSMGSTD